MFPKWLLNRFELWKDTIVLLNTTPILYKQIVIPACKVCNSTHLSGVEDAVADATLAGAKAVKALSSDIVFLWGAKLLYGLLYLKTRLRAKRDDISSASIIPADSIRSLTSLFAMLQGFRKRLLFREPRAYSLVVFDLQTVGELRDNFDFRDSLKAMSLYLRLGAVGIIIALEDVGLTERALANSKSLIGDHPLHPLQFMELSARAAYTISRAQAGPRFLISDNPDDITVISMFDPDLSQFEAMRYGHVLSAFTGQPITQTYVPPDRNWSWLTNSDGTFSQMNLIPEHNFDLHDRPLSSDWSRP